MKKGLFAALAAAALLFGGAEAREVTVTGVGATETEAKADAMRQAVEEAVGSLISSDTLVNNYSVVEDNIYATSQGYVERMDVLASRTDADGTYRVTARIDVNTDPDSALMNTLTRLQIIDVGMRNAKIAVIIPDDYHSNDFMHSAAEQSIIKAFLAAGFQNIIDVSRERMTYNQPFNLTADQLASVARSMQADILIVGAVRTENAGDIGRFIHSRRPTNVESVQAQMQAKMYLARTGQIIAADGMNGAAANITRSAAEQEAIANAGAQMGDYLVGEALNYYSGNRQAFEMTVIGSGIDAVNRVKVALAGAPGVKNVSLANYANGRGELRMQYAGSPQTLFAWLERNTEIDLTLQESAFNSMTVSAR